MDRISVDELRALIDDDQKLLILDVRPKEARMQHGIIPGAVPAHPDDIDSVVTTYSREQEIIVYCACPNEASAAVAAKHLKQAGFKKIRPLLGGDRCVGPSWTTCSTCGAFRLDSRVLTVGAPHADGACHWCYCVYRVRVDSGRTRLVCFPPPDGRRTISFTSRGQLAGSSSRSSAARGALVSGCVRWGDRDDGP